MINNSPISTKTKESLNSDDQQFTNINKTKESLNSDDQQFTNINKTKESLNSDDQQFTNINKTNNHLCLLNILVFCVVFVSFVYLRPVS
jgi:phosphoglycerate-specific signal transduction histidine kinase